MVKFNYTYDATGTRLVKKVEPTSGTTVTTEYLGGFQYENNDLQFFFQPEGYVKKDENAYLYVFQYKDHLGNVRLSYADCNNDGIIQSSSEILEENNYYPFGLKHQGYNDISNSCKSEQAEKYQYNGKEWDDALGLNIYEMDLRQYDPAIGRWTVQDPVTHHDYSPYSAFDNNPVYWSDPSGADATTYTLNGKLVGASFTGQDAIDAFLQLIGESSNDYFEVAVQNTYELSTLPNDENGGDGNGNGGGNGTKLKGGPFDGLNSGNIPIYNDFYVFYLDKRHVTQLSHLEAFELFEIFFKSRQQMFEQVMFWGDKSGYLPIANFKSLMKELGKANPTRLSAQALL